MIPGDSFFVPVEATLDSAVTHEMLALAAKRLGSAAFCYCKSHDLDWKFSVRRQPEEKGVRIWRKS